MHLFQEKKKKGMLHIQIYIILLHTPLKVLWQQSCIWPFIGISFSILIFNMIIKFWFPLMSNTVHVYGSTSVHGNPIRLCLFTDIYHNHVIYSVLQLCSCELPKYTLLKLYILFCTVIMYWMNNNFLILILSHNI